MAAKWPASLTKCVESSSFQETEDPQYVNTTVDNGPIQTERVVNRGFSKVNVSLIIDKAQYLVFDYWWKTALGGGAGAFNFNHPITKELKSYRAIRPYKIGTVGPRNWKISMEWGEVGLTAASTTVTSGDRSMYYENLTLGTGAMTITLSPADENFQVFAITTPGDLIMDAVMPFTGSPPDGTEVLIINVTGGTMKFTSTGSFSMNGDCILHPGRSLTMVKASSGYYEKGRA